MLTYLLDDAAPVLLDTYGGMPARERPAGAVLRKLDELFPQGVNWQVAIDGLERPDVPSHECNMPNFVEAEAVIDEFEGRSRRSRASTLPAAAEELRVGARPRVRRRSGADRPGTEPAGTEPAGTEPADDGDGDDLGLRFTSERRSMR